MRNCERRRTNARLAAHLTGIVAIAGLASASPTWGQTPSVERVSLNRDGGDPNDRNELPAVNFDGSIVGFKSLASNLVEGDTNRLIDVYVRDRRAGVNERIPNRGEIEGETNGEAYPPSLDANGRIVVFGSAARNIVRNDFNLFPDVFSFDRAVKRAANLTLVLDQFEEGRLGGRVPDLPPSIDYEGNLVAFVSASPYFTDIDDNETEDVFVYDRRSQTVELISITDLSGTGFRSANGPSGGAVISGNGKFVVFCSDASNLVPGAPRGVANIYRRDLENDVTQHVASLPRGRCLQRELTPAVSASGEWIAYASDPDNDGSYDIYLWNGESRLVSVPAHGDRSDGSSTFPSVSADGRFVAYQTTATNMIHDDTNDDADVMVFDRDTGEVRRVSVRADGSEAGQPSGAPKISGDGRTVVFHSMAPLVGDDGNGELDIYAVSNTLADDPTPTPTATAEATETETPVLSTPTRTATGTFTVAPSTPTPTASIAVATATRTSTAVPTATKKSARQDDDGCAIQPRAEATDGAMLVWLGLPVGMLLGLRRRRS